MLDVARLCVVAEQNGVHLVEQRAPFDERVRLVAVDVEDARTVRALPCRVVGVRGLRDRCLHHDGGFARPSQLVLAAEHRGDRASAEVPVAPPGDALADVADAHRLLECEGECCADVGVQLAERPCSCGRVGDHVPDGGENDLHLRARQARPALASLRSLLRHRPLELLQQPRGPREAARRGVHVKVRHVELDHVHDGRPDAVVRGVPERQVRRELVQDLVVASVLRPVSPEWPCRQPADAERHEDAHRGHTLREVVAGERREDFPFSFLEERLPFLLGGDVEEGGLVRSPASCWFVQPRFGHDLSALVLEQQPDGSGFRGAGFVSAEVDVVDGEGGEVLLHEVTNLERVEHFDR